MYWLLLFNDNIIFYNCQVKLISLLSLIDYSILIILHIKLNLMIDIVGIDIINNHF